MQFKAAPCTKLRAMSDTRDTFGLFNAIAVHQSLSSFSASLEEPQIIHDKRIIYRLRTHARQNGTQCTRQARPLLPLPGVGHT